MGNVVKKNLVEKEKNMVALVKRFLSDEKGTETVEWAIIIGIIAIGAIIMCGTIGAWVLEKFTNLNAITAY